ncbi:transporter [Micrococcus luteus]|nr:transporter [Micrococcus luteus]
MIDNAVYVDGRRVHAPSTLEDTWEAAEASGGMAWLGLYRPDADELRAVADELHLHPLAVEDALEGGERAKLDRYGEDLFMVLHFQHAIRALPVIVEQLQGGARARLREEEHRREVGAPRTGDVHEWDQDELSEEGVFEVENLRRLRDVHDHAVQINERVAAMRQMLANALELDSTLASKRLAEQSIEQNEQVKQISSWAAIIFAPQLVGSIYGMNFDGMPELHWAFGYPFALGLMLAVALTLFVLFKRADWL